MDGLGSSPLAYATPTPDAGVSDLCAKSRSQGVAGEWYAFLVFAPTRIFSRSLAMAIKRFEQRATTDAALQGLKKQISEQM